MSQNTFKIKKGEGGTRSFFSILESLKVSTLFNDGIPSKYIPHVVYLTFIGIFYIGNTHFAEKTIRDIEKLEVEVEELRADYTSLKADYMFAGKQSEVAKKVKEIDLEESKKPPFKIIIE